MVITAYLQALDELIGAAPEVKAIEILRRSLWDTGMEKIAMYRYKLIMSDGSLLELTERLIQEGESLSLRKYRHHCQDSDARLLKIQHAITEKGRRVFH